MNAEQFLINIESHCEKKLTDAFNDKARWEQKYGNSLPQWATEKLETQAQEVNAFKALIQIIRTLQSEVQFNDKMNSYERVKDKSWYKVLNQERDFRDTIIREVDDNFKDLIKQLNQATNSKMKLFKIMTVEMKCSIETIKGELAKYHEIRDNHKTTLFD